MKIYLDNCCYNRPYDDQFQFRIQIETQAKLHIQDLIKNGRLDLVTSYVLDYENSNNPYEMRRNSIGEFITSETSAYVDACHHEELAVMVDEII